MTHRLMVFLLCFISPALAQAITQYQASIVQSQWSIKSTKIRCELNHDIPHYGQGSFVHSSGGELSFLVKSSIPFMRNRVVNVLSIAPFWRPSADQTLGQISMVKGSSPLYAQGELAERIKYELIMGKSPTFQYKDFFDKDVDIQVGLSFIRFSEKLPEFKRCIDKLIDFKVLKSITVNYKTGKHRLSTSAKRDLEDLAVYAFYDKNIEIFIEGHTDNRGTRRYNLMLSKRRTNSVKSYFLSKGVDRRQIKFRSFGEKHLASRKWGKGQASDRRVEVTFSKPK